MVFPTTLFLSILIFLGAAIMLVNIVRFHGTIKVLNQFHAADTRRLQVLARVHMVLMVFFFFGYLVVGAGTIVRAAFVSEIFVAVIFFLGAVFVWLGILLQHLMISMIQRRYDQTLQAKADIEQQHAQLAQANLRLTSEIAERQRVEKALRDSERRIQQIVDQLPAGVLVIDEEARQVKAANPAALDMIGLPQSSVVGAPCNRFLCPLEPEGCSEEQLTRAMGKPMRVWLETSGEKIPVLNTVSRIDLDGHRHLLQSFIDLSDKERLEARLRRAQKMEALGTMAGGVAHDLNNILSGIVSYPELVLHELPADSPLRRPIRTIMKSGEKAAAIVKDLLALARRGVEIKEVLNLKAVIGEYFDSPEHRMLMEQHPNIIFSSEIEKDLFNILGSPVHLLKTIMNLIRNGAEAMPGGGTMRVRAENRYLDRPIEGYDHVEEGDYAVLTISDTGVGITPEDRDHIFEPFYTNKKMAHSGSGLGMAVVWGTVKDHMGYINIESASGRGTVFTLFFPATRRQVPSHPPAAAIDVYKGHGESILVVDDVAVQRELASDMLGMLGYDVHTVASGEAALDYLQDRAVDLVLLDMIMDSGINGLATYQRILKIHPGQRAVVVSGYSETRDVQQCLDLGVHTYVSKPYNLEAIAMAVSDALAK